MKAVVYREYGAPDVIRIEDVPKPVPKDHQLLVRVRATTGIDLEIISGREEANLALAGCAPLLDQRKRHALIFDIGGGRYARIFVGLGEGWVAPKGEIPSPEDIAANLGAIRNTESFTIPDSIAGETGATFEFIGGIRRPPLSRTDASVALYEAYAECARAAGLGDGECPLIGGGSDANMVSAVGVPAIDGLGPRGRGFHTHDEYIEVSTLAQRIEALVRYLLRD